MAVAREKEPATKGPTWRDLLPDMPDQQLVTREQLLATLVRGGVPVTERSLRHWEAQGVVPRPVNQWHDGATRSVYPEWFDLVVNAVASRREKGEGLASIKADIARVVRFIAGLHWMTEKNIYPFPDKGVPDVEEAARHVAQVSGRPVAGAALVFIGPDGEPVATYRQTFLSSDTANSPPDDRTG
jgi:hypothetical protein